MVERYGLIGKELPVEKSGGGSNYIYFLQCKLTGLVKIGRTLQLSRRLPDIQTMCPTPLKVIGLLEAPKWFEEMLHERFSDLRTHGEWFKLADDMEIFIGRCRGGYIQEKIDEVLYGGDADRSSAITKGWFVRTVNGDQFWQSLVGREEPANI